LLDSGEQSHIENSKKFSFELSWLKKEGFTDLVSHKWNSVPHDSNPMINWQNKIRHLRHFLRGWAQDQSGKYKIEKKD
jgi:hypothetical protein